ncbi:uro-adherence factor A-like [Trachinotus anak]|uniref:uro-adherence factor A-like n=1 Tax=Trachinotus anak TaxID=443729 RepID=UPI0039F1AA83
MEYWPEHQGQSPLYAKFGTVPGRNCTHNYHDRHQATHYPLYYGKQQDQGRESSYWTVPGSRTGGVPQDYTNWTDPEPPATTSSHFPFILDCHTKQHHDLGEYQPHEARDREWTTAQRAAREYERGFLREGWQRRWEPCSPVRYNREASIKRSDSSYRELEAWAARYSHSLPRRRRIEAELRGASQGLLESSRAPERDGRSGADPRVAALQQVRQPANIRESGVWDRGGRQQTLAYYPTQAPAPDTSHMLDIKEKTGYQRRMFSQPPGYIAPPPYNSPHKSSPVMHRCDTSWEQDSKRQTYWSQPTLRKQDVSVDLQDKRKTEKEDLTKPDGNKTCAELDGLKHREQGLNALQASSPISVQNTHMQHECMSSLQQSQMIPTVQNTKTNEQMSSKVIEGRKFRLNKKTGGMTIFCLVSRIADTTETPSLLLCTSQTNTEGTELGEVSKDFIDGDGIYQTQKLADEVDFRVPALTEQSNTSDTRNLKEKQMETPTCVESEILGDNLSNKAETDAVSPEKNSLNNANSTYGRQVAQAVQPVSVKYPLWREPSFTSRAETESSFTFLKANSEEGESDGLQNPEECATVHPVNVEATELDIKEDTQSEDSKGLLGTDTTCVVKMDLIPSPKKEQVHYLSSTPHTEDSPLDIQLNTCPESNSQLNQDEALNVEINPLQVNERPETELDSDPGEKKEPKEGGDISFPWMPSSPISEKETLEERAERILGIPLHDCITEQQPEDATSFLDLCVKKQDVEVVPSPITNDIHDAAEQLPVDTAEEERSQNHSEVGQTEHLKESDDAEDEVKNQEDEHFAGPQEQMSDISEEKDTDSQLETDIKTSQETKIAEEILLEPSSDKGTTEQSQEENLPVENDASSQHPSQCFSPPISNSSLPSHSDPTALSYTSQLNTELGLESQLAALDTTENLAPHSQTTSLPYIPSQQLPSPLSSGSAESSPSTTPHTHHSLSPPRPVDLMYQMADAMSGIEDQDEEGETSQLINNEISDAFEDLQDQEVGSQEQSEYEQPVNAACVEESNTTDEQHANEVERDSTDLLEQTLETSKENTIDVGILQQQLECVQAEDVFCVKESFVTEEQLQQDADEDPAELLETTILQEKVPNNQSQVEVKILKQQFDNGQEGDASTFKESHMTEEQSQKEASEDTGLSAQTSEISKENANDSQVEVKALQQKLYYGQEGDTSSINDSYVTEKQSLMDADEDPSGLLETTILQESVTDSQTQVEIKTLQQQFDNSQEEDTSTVKQSHMTEEQSPKEASEDTGLPAQTSEISKENANDSQVEVKALQQKLYYGQEGDTSSVNDSYATEKQSLMDADEDPGELLETTILQESVTDSQTQVEVKILQQQFDKDTSTVKQSHMTEEQSQKEASEDTGLSVQTSEISKVLQQQLYYGQEGDTSCVKDSYVTEKQSLIDADEDPAGLLEQKISQENATDCQTQIEIEILQDVEPKTEPTDSPSPSPSNSDSKVSQSPLDVLSPSDFPSLPSPPHASPKPDTEPVSFLETDTVCPSALNITTAEAGIPETVPPPLQLISCEESLKFPSSSTSKSAPQLASSTSISPHEDIEGVSLDLPDKEEPQYPKSLWDAVNRIRKHTAPDSENEEEEVSEQWDPESIGEDLGCPDVVNSERIVLDEVGQHKVSTESVEDVEQDQCHEEPSRHAEEDTLSCSSISSSGDTVIVAEEDEVEETPPDAMTESKTETGEEFPTAEGEQCCFGEVKDETTAVEGAEDELDKGDKKEFCLSEERTAEVGNVTVEAMEMTEIELKENEEVVVVSDEVTG